MTENLNSQVWLLSHSYLPARGGIENYLREVARSLIGKGYRPAVICRGGTGLSAEEEIEGVRVIRHPDFPVSRHKLFSKHLYLAEKIAGWLRESPYCRTGWSLCRYPHYQFALSALEGGCPGIYLPAAVWPALAPLSSSAGGLKARFFELWWRRQAAYLERESLRRADRVMVFSRNILSQLERFHGIDPRTVTVNPPGVDSERFRPRPPAEEMLRSLKLDPSRRRILFLGRLSPEKNLIFLLRALAPLLREDRAELLLAGDGPLRAILEKEIERLNLGSSARVLPPTERPEDLYPLGDIFVSPSRYESFGQTILEAMASGLPVVALKSAPPKILTAAAEIIEDGRSGYTVAEDPAELRNRVKELLASPELRKQMGQAGREISRERFNWGNHLRELRRTAERLEAGNGRRT